MLIKIFESIRGGVAGAPATGREDGVDELLQEGNVLDIIIIIVVVVFVVIVIIIIFVFVFVVVVVVAAIVNMATSFSTEEQMRDSPFRVDTGIEIDVVDDARQGCGEGPRVRRVGGGA